MLMMVTGVPGSGKSTLCQKVVDALGWKPGGFLTLPVFAEEIMIGFDLFPLERGKVVTPGFPIARKKKSDEYTVSLDTFTEIGVKAIESGLKNREDCIVMDEIGRFEKDNEIFLMMVWEALMQREIPVMVVLKKEKLAFNQKVWGLEKGIHVDLDLMDRDEAYILAVDYFKKKMKNS